MDQKTLNNIIHAHEAWLAGEPGGVYADLRGADLRYRNLGVANLRGANLWGADLYGANLDRSILWNTDLRGVFLQQAVLRYSDLRCANLSGADLRTADLEGVVGNAAEIKSLQVERWPVTYTSEDLQIGCERHPIEDWWQFPDSIISAMAGVDVEALEYWHKWRDTLKAIIETSPAVPTT